MRHTKFLTILILSLSLCSCISTRPATTNELSQTDTVTENIDADVMNEDILNSDNGENSTDNSSEVTTEQQEESSSPPPLDNIEYEEEEKREFEDTLLDEILSYEPEEEEEDSKQTVKEETVISDTEDNSAEIQTGRFKGKSVTFTAAGDNLIHPNIYLDAASRDYTGEGNGYNFKPMYDDVAELISSADVAFINQETIMAGEDYGYSGWPCFNSPRQLAYDLVDLGFDVVNIANNHMLDKGASGLESAIEFWNSLPVTMIGGYLNEDDYETVRVTENDGIKFAWLSYTCSTNGIVKSASSEAVIPYIEDEKIVEDLARAEGVGDFTIVSIHWGVENTQTPTDEQVRVAKLLAENGADIIIGHHSHTLQPIEWIETERGRTLCIYSLGTLVSGMASPINMVAGFANFTVCGDESGELTVADVSFTPTVFYYGMDWYNTHIYLLDDYTDYIASSHGLQISGYTLSPESARAYVTNVISDEFLK